MMDEAVAKAKRAADHLITRGGNHKLVFSYVKGTGMVLTTSEDISKALCALWNAAVGDANRG